MEITHDITAFPQFFLLNCKVYHLPKFEITKSQKQIIQMDQQQRKTLRSQRRAESDRIVEEFRQLLSDWQMEQRREVTQLAKAKDQIRDLDSVEEIIEGWRILNSSPNKTLRFYQSTYFTCFSFGFSTFPIFHPIVRPKS